MMDSLNFSEFRHGSSLFTHEAAIAVGKVAPASFWEYDTLVRTLFALPITAYDSIISNSHRITQLYKRQEEYFDKAVQDLTPNQIRDKLVALAGEVPSIGKDKLAAIRDLITYKTTPNGGVDVTDDIKWFSKSLFPGSIFAWEGVLLIRRRTE